MQPTSFEYANKVLQPSGTPHSANVESVVPLPVWTDGEQCVSCWRPSLRERLSILVFGRVWVAVLSGQTQPPICVTGSNRYFRLCIGDAPDVPQI